MILSASGLRRVASAFFILIAIAFAGIETASAGVLYSLNATRSDTGTISGTFEYDSGTNTYSNVSISSSAGAVITTAGSYTVANSTVFSGEPVPGYAGAFTPGTFTPSSILLPLVTNVADRILVVAFSSALTGGPAGTTVPIITGVQGSPFSPPPLQLDPSFEIGLPGGGIQIAVESGTVTVVPVPAPLGLSLFMFGLASLLLLRRNSVSL